MKKKFKAITIILIILLVIRIFSQFFIGFSSANINYLIIYSIVGAIYLIALIGIFMKQKWGAISIMVIAIIDILFVFITGGAAGLGAGVIDLILLFLGYKNYKEISS